MIRIAKQVTIVSCKQSPQLCGKTYTIIDETKHSFVLCKHANLIVDKKIRLLKAGLEIMVA